MKKQKKQKKQKAPETVDVTKGGVTMSFMEDEAVNPANWVTLKKFDKILNKYRKKVAKM
jgi:CRISPR/Cas system-associated protein Csx1